MFCYHCQEAKKNIACDTTGICGKKSDISSLHDLLTYTLKGLAYYADQAMQLELADKNINQFMARALYAMVTNVNFDADIFVALISESIQRREYLKRKLIAQGVTFKQLPPEETLWHYEKIDLAEFIKKGETVGVLPAEELLEEEADLHAAREMLMYAAKGLGALLEHIQVLDNYPVQHYAFIHKAVAYILDKEAKLDDILAMNYACGEKAMELMALLEQINTEKFGDPEPTQVHLDTWEKPGIIVTGHNLQDLHDLLEQSAGSGVDIYTHGELLAAHSYPVFKKYFNLVANYGGAWQEQKTQFGKFKGPVLVTSNSLQQPKKGYLNMTYTSGMAGWSGLKHIADRRKNATKDFSAMLEQAKNCPAPDTLNSGSITTGYGKKALQALVAPIIELIKSADIQHILVLAGCDGRHKERKYYTELVKSLPSDTLIITAGETKYRFYNLELGKIKGVPRLLDVGQAHDFHKIIHFLTTLQNKMQLSHINKLPVSFHIAWYEQQTILMMLALFQKNIKNIIIGPTLPPFFSVGILDKLTTNFAIKGISNVNQDIANMLDIKLSNQPIEEPVT
jgi:hydroxylamine reductase